MTRLALSFALLLSAAVAQGMTPARQDANGSAGRCPNAAAAVAHDAIEATAPAPVAAAPVPQAASAAAAPISREDSISQPKAGPRWHSFLPGMFK